MQLTRFDRWLREKYVYEMHIHTLRPTEYIPDGIEIIELPDVPGKRYKHLYVAKSNKAADELIHYLKENGQMYTTQVVDRDVWYAPFIAPKDKSVSWWLFSVFSVTITSFYILLFIKGLVEDPEFRKNFMEAIEVLKG
ncbi:MAG: hypothetical protein H8M99_01355 [Gloeobacteraceae cyanobacterium ES-bin-144]|nr:hypothetical protein [Verrucomicrobiales bacterium]